MTILREIKERLTPVSASPWTVYLASLTSTATQKTKSRMSEILEKSSFDRLITAVMDSWMDQGGEAISARQICGRAGTPVSSLYHHFGSLERLLACSHEAAQAQTRLWCGRWIEELSGFDAPPSALGPFFAAVVDDWTNVQRRHAFAWREGQLWRTESDVAAGVRDGWRTIWTDFWKAACARFGLGERAWLIERFHDAESFNHMIRWRRPIDRAGLDEFARGAAAWAAGERPPASPWRDLARNEAVANAPVSPELDGTTMRVAAAAAALIEESGPAAITHRAVAEHAGLTLGVVSHKLRTKAELLQAGFESIYLDAVARFRERQPSIPTGNRGAALDAIADLLAASLGGRGMDALCLAVARDPALEAFGLQLRYMRGTTSRGLLALLRPELPTPSHLEAALLSAFLTAVSRRLAYASPEDAAPAIRLEVEALIDLLPC
ncbi:TetR family transcriptional regulator [Rhizorhabdus sp. FW153]